MGNKRIRNDEPELLESDLQRDRSRREEWDLSDLTRGREEKEDTDDEETSMFVAVLGCACIVLAGNVLLFLFFSIFLPRVGLKLARWYEDFLIWLHGPFPGLW